MKERLWLSFSPRAFIRTRTSIVLNGDFVQKYDDDSGDDDDDDVDNAAYDDDGAVDDDEVS